MSDGERAAIAVLAGAGFFVVRYLVGVWRGEPWRKHLGTLAFTVGLAMVLVAAFLVAPAATGLFALPALLLVGGVFYLRQAPPERRTLAWLAIAAGVGGLLLNVLRLAMFGSQ